MTRIGADELFHYPRFICVIRGQFLLFRERLPFNLPHPRRIARSPVFLARYISWTLIFRMAYGLNEGSGTDHMPIERFRYTAFGLPR